MKWFLNAFGGTLGVIVALGFVVILGFAGCFGMCSGILFHADRAAKDAHGRTEVYEGGEFPGRTEKIAPITGVPIKPDEPPHKDDPTLFGIPEKPLEPAEEPTAPEPTEEEKQAAREKAAQSQLDLVQPLMRAGNKFAANRRLQSIVDKYPGTKAAKKAERMLPK